jgi:hypothetical protein
MDPFCAKQPPRAPPTAEQVLQGLCQREQGFKSVKFTEFTSFDQLTIEKDKLLLKYSNQYDLPTYNMYCRI